MTISSELQLVRQKYFHRCVPIGDAVMSIYVVLEKTMYVFSFLFPEENILRFFLEPARSSHRPTVPPTSCASIIMPGKDQCFFVCPAYLCVPVFLSHDCPFFKSTSAFFCGHTAVTPRSTALSHQQPRKHRPAAFI